VGKGGKGDHPEEDVTCRAMAHGRTSRYTHGATLKWRKRLICTFLWKRPKHYGHVVPRLTYRTRSGWQLAGGGGGGGGGVQGLSARRRHCHLPHGEAENRNVVLKGETGPAIP